MIGVEKALAAVERAVSPLPGEAVKLSRALGRTLSRDVRADADLPAFDLSAMDGYAGRDFSGEALRVRGGTLGAGSPPARPLRPGEAVRLMTGAVVPAGADAVLPLEEAIVEGSRLCYRGRPPAGGHVRRRGEVYRRGEILLPAGTTLTPEAIALCAAAGADPVFVRRLPRCRLAVTGDEMVDPGSRPPPGMIRNSNGVALIAALERRGVAGTRAAAIPDHPGRLSKFFAAARGADLVVTTGGVSVGDFDHTIASARRAGYRVLFHGVAIKPGKPVAFGRAGRSFWFGLPGNPVSALTTFELFVAAALDRFAGRRPSPTVQARLSEPLTATGKRACYLDAEIEAEGLDRRARPIPSRGSHDLKAAARRNGLILLPAGGGSWPSGAIVPVKELG